MLLQIPLLSEPRAASDARQDVRLRALRLNRALKWRSDTYHEQGETLRYRDTAKTLTQWKQEPETVWLQEVSNVPLQQALRHLEKAYTNFFRGNARFPRFKAKRSRQSASYMSNAFSLKDSGSAAGPVWAGHGPTARTSRVQGQPIVTLAKIKSPLKIRWSRPLPSDPVSLTVTKDSADRYFISFRVDIEPEPLPERETAVGIDLGIADIVVTSSGSKYGNPRFLKRDIDKLKREQKKFSRKVKGSSNSRKQRRKVAHIHARIADRRQDYLHKLTTRLIRDNQTICLETLRVQNMLKNHCLAQAISDVSWSELVRQLEYKAAWYGRWLVKIDQWYPSSKRCSDCGHVAESMPLSVREWVCPACGVEHDRDVNAAVNILAVGTTVIAPGGQVRPAASVVAEGFAR